jgi:hypothetical protein
MVLPFHDIPSFMKFMSPNNANLQTVLDNCSVEELIQIVGLCEMTAAIGEMKLKIRKHDDLAKGSSSEDPSSSLKRAGGTRY